VNLLDQFSKKVLPIDIEEEMRKSFISYAMAVIINRALPDVRDGFKPVHRRILYSMHELGFTPDKPFRKCARIVGDVLGKYHPHGDTAVYDSMVRMAQDFSMRYMLVEGQGNFGSVDGDGAAAMRYTEARLSKIASEMLADLDKDTVDYYPNFDETLMQPVVLPSRYPNLLVNGSGGIAVGMATNIPPHNLGETIDATIELIDNPDADVGDLMEHIKGPDFPTGGVIMGMGGIRSAYATGRGRVIVRAKAEIEEYDNNRYRIVVNEIPYQVNKARLVEKIAELVHEKKIEGISDLRDESDKAGMRIVIELKRDAIPNIILNQLYKHTQMQDTFGVIMLALVDGEPKVLSLKQMLRHYIDHQKDVITRRTIYDKNKAEARAHILEGLLIALDNIDEVIAIIKASKTAAEARKALMERFELSEKQAQAILDMRLQRLTGLERIKLEEEFDQLMKTIAWLNSILADESLLMSIIKEELIAVKEKYSDERRTEITMSYEDIDIEDLIAEEDMVVTLTHFGYIKRLPADTYRSQRRGGKGIAALSTREEDFVERVFVTTTHKYILFFTNTGRVFKLKCYELPESGRTAKGAAIVNFLQLQEGEKITEAFPLEHIDHSHFILWATKQGIVKKTALNEFTNIRKGGIIAIGLREGDELMSVIMTTGDDQVIIGTKNGYSIRFSETDIRPMGRTATGVKGISLRPGDEVVDMELVRDDAAVLSISENGYGKLTNIDEYNIQYRGGLGIKTMNITEKTGPLVALKMVTDEDDCMIMSADGTIIRIETDGISTMGRSTQGVRLMRVDDSTSVVCVARVPKGEDEEEITECELLEDEENAEAKDEAEMPEDGVDAEEEE
jgi:DNA gyrase subunit A